MAAKDRNIKKNLSDFLRYREGSLTESERNAFERELQKDLFAAEAEEGFSTVDPDSIRKDIGLLGERLRKRTKGKSRFMIYRFAASLAIILGIASVFIILQRTHKTGETETRQEPLIIAESRPLSREKAGQSEADDISPTSPLLITEKKTDAEVRKVKPATVQTEAILAPDDTMVKEVAEDKPAVQPVISLEAEVMAEAAAVPVPETAKARTDARRAEVLNAGGAEMAGKAATDIKTRDNIPPIPSTGMEGFEKYIRDNMQLPEGFKAGEKLTVELSFIVRTNGRPDKIQVVKSPGKPFSDEAIRLLKDGPDWIPAMRNGKIISDTARVTIEFRKD
ncbi:MAG: hypothetical protein GYA43_11665 [Bacteroidales bacterium]|nr:hypothetical protein [Bacteroidales bacterium]